MRQTGLLSFAVLAVAACAPKPAEPPAAAALATVDQAAVKPAMDSIRAQYMRLQAAGDAAGIAGLFTPDGAIDFFEAPPMRGRAAIEAGLKAGFGMRKPISLEIVATATNAVNPSTATELGTYHEMDSVKGKTYHAWGRWVTSDVRDSTGVWRLSYLMAFPDSTRQDK